MSSRIPQLRRSAFRAQNGCCFYCSLPMWEDDPELFARTLGLSLLAKPRNCVPRPSTLQATRDVTEYIVGFYNNVRLHSKLGYLSPTAYERDMAEKHPIGVSEIT